MKKLIKKIYGLFESAKQKQIRDYQARIIELDREIANALAKKDNTYTWACNTAGLYEEQEVYQDMIEDLKRIK